MNKTTYMLDTCICSFIIREHPVEVLNRLQSLSNHQHRIVISAITYSEMLFGTINKKASPKHRHLVDNFIQRIDEVLPWDAAAVERTTDIKRELNRRGTPIGANDTAIAGHAISSGCILVTNNIREFERVPDLRFEDWVH